jgi:hypothetical protein
MIRGDAMVGIAAIGQLKATIRKLGEVPRGVAIEAAPKINRLIREQFTNGLDPYGNQWAPLKPSTVARGRYAPPLTDTRKLRDGTLAKPRTGLRSGLVLLTGAAYGYFAQVGFRVGGTKVPPRRVLPQHGLPVAWKMVLRDAARACARRAVA